MNALLSVTIFLAIGAAFVLANLAMGAIARPSAPNHAKGDIYECGEQTIGSGWVQFDLRFYIIALLYLVFDVEVALLYPWAIAWGRARELARTGQIESAFGFRAAALIELFVFFGILLVGFAYLWQFGYLDWVRSAATTSLDAAAGSATNADALPTDRPDLSALARKDVAA